MLYRAIWLLIILLPAALTNADTTPRSLIIKSFHADVTVKGDGTIEVTEMIRPQFTGSWNGIYRTIPIRYQTPQGFGYTLRLSPESITDDHGRSLRYESSLERHYRKFKIYVPDAQDATRTVIIRYRVENGLKFFEEHDELYWNITGDEWEVPIEAASAQITLPEGITGLRAVAFTGGYGSREQAANVDIGERSVSVRTLRSLNFREGLTVAVGWNPGVISRPTPTQQTVSFLQGNWLFGFPIAAFVLMFWLWYTRGRDPRRRSIVAQYEPPEGMTPGEVGTLIDNYPHMRDITATVVDLAVRGFILIEEREKEQWFGLSSKKDYAFVMRKPRSAWRELLLHEYEVLSAIFIRSRDETVELSDLENRFYKHLPDIRSRIYDRLVERGYYRRRPDKVKQWYLIGAVAVGVACFVIGNVTGYVELAPFGTIAASGLTFGIVALFGLVMPARTAAGAVAQEGVLGFEEFLDRVESDRFERMITSPEMFEKYLPFAMALGVEKKWAAAFAGIYDQPPDWYRGSSFHTFHTGSFVSDLGRMSTQAASVMTSSPRSSGGSGFSGGSSGGGFGGGGGGGF